MGNSGVNHERNPPYRLILALAAALAVSGPAHAAGITDVKLRAIDEVGAS
jgi:hypothetical protein